MAAKVLGIETGSRAPGSDADMPRPPKTAEVPKTADLPYVPQQQSDKQGSTSQHQQEPATKRLTDLTKGYAAG